MSFANRDNFTLICFFPLFTISKFNKKCCSKPQVRDISS